jgi:hypothetical protein
MALRMRVERSEEPRLDLGVFGGAVTVLLVGLVVLAVAVVALADVNVWPLALFAVAALVLWTRWIL